MNRKCLIFFLQLIFYVFIFSISLACLGKNKDNKNAPSDNNIIDSTPPDAPIDLKISPDTWTNLNLFTIDWTNPPDPSEIAGAYYKLNSPPASDKDGMYIEKKPFKIITSNEGEQVIYVWLKDKAGNINYKNNNMVKFYYDATPPIVSFPNPDKEAIDVLIDIILSAKFNEKIDSSTINSSSFILKADSSLISGNVIYDTSQNTIFFYPEKELEKSTKYQAMITTNVKDLAGNPLKTDYLWSFITGTKISIPKISVTPTSLFFYEGEINSQTINITNPGSGTLNWSMDDDRSWLSLAPLNGTTTTETDSIEATVEISGLKPGIYIGAINIISDGGNQTISVNLTIPEPIIPVLNAAPVSLDFDTGAVSKTINITNSGTGELTWSLNTEQTWIEIAALNGSITTETNSIEIKVNRTGLVPGIYNGTINLISNGGNQIVTIAMEIPKIPEIPILNVSPDSLNFDTSIISKIINITNAGTGTLVWSITDNQLWLDVTPVSGTSQAEIDSVTVTVNRDNLEPGIYTAIINIISDGGTKNLTAVMTVPGPEIPILNASPISLDFDTSAILRTIKLTNAGTGTLIWSIDDDQTWLGAAPLNGTTTTETDNITVVIDRAGLPPNTYTGTISLISNGGNLNIPVSMTTIIPPAITSTPITIGEKNELYTYTVAATDPKGYPLVYSLTQFPSGMTINQDSGVISWTPTGGGIYNVIVAVNNNYGGIASQSFSIAVARTYITGGIIDTDTTYKLSDQPYIVTGNITVNNGITLTIEPGVTLRFNQNSSLQIDGTLKAQGTNNNKIVFTSNQKVPQKGDWGKILFYDSSTDATFNESENYIDGSILEYATIEYTGENAAMEAADAHPFINNSIIRNNIGTGIYANISNQFKILNSNVSNNDVGGIIIYGDSSFIKGNTIENNKNGNKGGGIDINGDFFTVSNNTIRYNTTSMYGGGINIYFGEGIVSNNLLDGNTSNDIGGGISNFGGTIVISNNIIRNNHTIMMNSYGGGGINNSGNASIINNLVYNNTSFYQVAGISSYKGTVSNNVVCDNIASDGTGGISVGEAAITNNTVYNNTGKYSAISLYNFTMDTVYIKNNTISGNIAVGADTTCAVIVSGRASFNYNNIFGNRYSIYDFMNYSSFNIDASNSWWGTTLGSPSPSMIYDYNYNNFLGFVISDPSYSNINTDNPISVPTGLIITNDSESGTVTLSWNANPEADIAGYKIYWGTDQNPPYSNSLDVGNVTGYMFSNLEIGTYYFAVTAYDTNYSLSGDNPDTIVDENQINGFESWYAR